MIARFAAWLRRTSELAAARAELRQVHKDLAAEQARSAALEQQAKTDRANAVRMADEIERLRLIADEAERLHRVIELGRAGIAVVA